MKQLRIPRRWEDVTPQWMTAAIASRHPQARVSGVHIVNQDDGTNRRSRFALDYEQGSGPERVFLKAHADAHRIVHLRNGNLFNEARLFATGAELPVDHPIVYAAVRDYLRLDFLLVMEDINQRGADPRDATRPMTVEQVANGLRGLARLHSRYWGGSKCAPQLRWVKTWKAAKGWQVGLRKRIPLGLGRGESMLPEPMRAMEAQTILSHWVRYVDSLSQAPVTLLHGDAHIGNTYVLPDNDIGFLDWQVVRWGNWSQDVGYFLVSALTEEERRANEFELIAIYRDALEIPAGQRPSLEDMHLRYRASVAYGLAIWLSTLGTDGWQSKDICLALVSRFASAFVELESEKALRNIA